ncbi:hypothetical protein NDU88_001821 [Pleurodeles waltl]|uniref:Uncharacterized protein n=1 Tax=Pleurodeles waltl TaxID=8319 RepID=A0AAV7P4Y8_PLEWA|nr:hypothetical protein NDU88_001821 [Pleurodeles waltl]
MPFYSQDPPVDNKLHRNPNERPTGREKGLYKGVCSTLKAVACKEDAVEHGRRFATVKEIQKGIGDKQEETDLLEGLTINPRPKGRLLSRMSRVQREDTGCSTIGEPDKRKPDRRLD